MKIYNQNKWVIEFFGEGKYIITDPKGKCCMTTHARVLSPDKIVVGHPLLPDMTVDTRDLRALPVYYLGDLHNKSLIRRQKKHLTKSRVDWRGPYYVTHEERKKSTIGLND